MRTLRARSLLLLATTLPLAGLPAACGGGEAPPPAGWRTADAFVRAMNRGVHCMERYDYGEAERAFSEALELSPGSNEARVNLALAVFNGTTSEDALERTLTLLGEVLEADPGDLHALYFRGLVRLVEGEPEAALADLQRVVEAQPRDGHAWYALARALRQSGQPSREALERAIEADPMLSSAYYELFQLVLMEEPDEREEATRLQELFTRLSAHPLANPMDPGKYGRMGPLALARPLAALPGPLAQEAALSFGPPRALLAASDALRLSPGRTAPGRVGQPTDSALAWADVDADGDLDAFAVVDGGGGISRVALLRNDGEAGLVDVSEQAGLAGIDAARSLALGDYDNDGRVDLYVARDRANTLLRQGEDGTFEDMTASTGTGGDDVAPTATAVFLDADHDADLDLYLCNPGEPNAPGDGADQLLRNNADGTFVDISAGIGLAGAAQRSVALAPIDLDDDRDTDLIVFHEGAPVSFFRNDLLEGFRPFDPVGQPIDGSRGGVAQDLDGDGRPDLLVFATAREPLRLYLGREVGPMERSAQLDGLAGDLPPAAGVAGTRLADLDLDGDLDVVLLGDPPLSLVNDGRGRFALRPLGLPQPARVLDVLDLDGDGVVDLVAAPADAPGSVALMSGRLDPPASWLGLTVTGQHSQAQATRSPASGYGTKVTVRAGVHSQTLVQTGLWGGPSQSVRPLVFGLDGAPEADFVHLRWPDAITQSETGLEASSYHVLAEMQRRPTSCPVLFSFDGERFVFVGDFAGVGGLGYNTGVGEPAQPTPRDLVRIDASQLVERDGRLELRVCEPMEEAAYMDRLELLAVDHPAAHQVFPDDRLVIGGPPPSQELLQVGRRFFPERASGPAGAIDPQSLREVDRVYAYSPRKDRRFFGYCEEHALVLEFGDELAALDPDRPTYLLVGGSLEYPYSQTNFATRQAGVTWDPPRVERLEPDGSWTTLVPDAGAPGGMARTIAVDLTGALPAGPVTLRLATTLELYFDRVFLAQDLGSGGLEVRTVPLARAELRRLGFPQEYSPDGRDPRIYSYDTIEASFGFQRLPGRYTRYGDVRELLGDFDDRYVVMATGDEIALEYDASALPEPAEGMARTWVLVSHAWCKDMDLHSVGPGTVEPLPFAGMSGYPYPAEESFPWSADARAWDERYNTRVIR